MRVYPRVCGGTDDHGHQAGDREGLSPRVRGNPEFVSCDRLALGSIPACAGEPQSERISYGDERVYPRVCGGTPDADGLNIKERGLSPRVRGNLNLLARRRRTPGSIPRVRGNHDVHSFEQRHKRSIPACAGEPFSPFILESLLQVYPRVCGGTNTQPILTRLQ